MSVTRGLAEAIRSELARRGLRVPVISDTGQSGPASPAACRRRGGTSWLADYEAAGNGLPSADVPPWTEYQAGGATQAVAGGTLTVTAAAAGDWLFNYVALDGLEATAGTLVEARLRVASSGGGANTGACLAVFDGQYLSVAWLRAGGLNVDGSESVAATLSDAWHRVAMHVLGVTVRVYVDGELVQTGAPVAPSTLKAAAFGSWVDTTP